MTSESILPAYTTGDIHGPVIKVIQNLNLDSKSHILDLGCGSGLLLKTIHEELGFSHLSGVDIDSGVNLDFAQFYQADLDHLTLPFADGTVDLVVATEVIEHVLNISSLLVETKRVLSSKGFIVLTTPNLESIEARLRYFLTGRLRQFDFRGDPTHCTPIHFFPFQRVLKWHGLEIKSFFGVPEKYSSSTSRYTLRIIARLCRLLGLKESPRGDSILFIIQANENSPFSMEEQKQDILRAHYG